MTLAAFVLGCLTGATVAVLACIACPQPPDPKRYSRRGREHIARHMAGEHHRAEMPVQPRWWTPADHTAAQAIKALTARFAPTDQRRAA